MQPSLGHSDEVLWQMVRQGKEEALSALFLKHADRLYNYGFLLCRDKEMVEDCLQDLFFQLWLKRDNLNDVGKVHTYLLIAIRNRIHDAFRKSKALKVMPIPLNEVELNVQENSVEEHWIDREKNSSRMNLVKKAIERLPERMKQVIYLRYFEGFEYKDIAEVMNISHQVAINMVYRATLKLKVFSEHYSESIFLAGLILLSFPVS